MEFYLYIFVAIVIFLPADRMALSGGARAAVMSIPFVLLLLLAGTRVSTGNDWAPYYEYYAGLTALGDKSEDFELGYRILSYLAKIAGFDHAVFLFLSTFLYLLAFFLVFRKQRGCIALVLLFYCTYLLGWMGTARQVIAIALTLLAGQSLLEENRLRFFLLVLLAASFHQTAVIFLLAWYLLRPVPRISIIIFILFLCAILGQYGRFLFPTLLDQFIGVEGLGEKVVFYGSLGSEELNQESSAILGLLWYVKRIFFLVILLFYRKHFKSPALAFYFNAYIFSVAIFLVVAPILPILATRGSNYFSIYELFLLASLVTLRSRFWVMLAIFVVLVAAQRLYTSLYAYHPDLYLPYKGQFINEDFRREVY